MKVIPSALPGVVVIEPRVHGDERGFFLETYHEQRYREDGIDARFVQDNHSRSRAGTLRGLHAQLGTGGQAKLVRVVEGEVYDVAVDIRVGSPNFGRWASFELSAESFRQVYIPTGFAHGFYVLSEWAQVEYKSTAYYDPASELSIAWNDPALAISWPTRQPILSPRDDRAPRLEGLMRALPRYEGWRA